jgi:hypothetical protein
MSRWNNIEDMHNDPNREVQAKMLALTASTQPFAHTCFITLSHPSMSSARCLTPPQHTLGLPERYIEYSRAYTLTH